MPFKYHESHRHHFKATPQKDRDWSDYNKQLKRRGDITIWLSSDVINQWVLPDRHYDGNGAPNLRKAR